MMKWKTLLTVLCFSLCVSILPIAKAAALDTVKPKLTLRLETKEAAVGQEISIVVKGEQLKDLYGYELKLKYNEAKLKFKSAAAKWKGMPVTPDHKNGVITFAHTKIGASTKGENGTADIATFVFEGKANGVAAIEIAEAKLVDSEIMPVQLKNAARTFIQVASASAIAFKDTKGHWAEAAINRAASLTIVNGYENGAFQANAQVTRAQFAAMLMRALDAGLDPAGSARYKDAGQFPAWARPFIESASRTGIITGYEDGTFRSERLITREEMAVMIMRASGDSLDAASVPAFADEARIAAWAKPAVDQAAKLGLVKGRGNNRFEPAAHATRAEAVTMILSLIDHLNK
ncbi:S-layer homology domain-containing protein [Paenibacillus sp. FJAT-27812]|uniref:S-layer homology domain-containing protein n=1 Tax=Paenibacillus sp. FJAT-27812 TaxID=1684143 RepID=UPI0006A77BF3|nr:S-layer homology domain-containing protein [Paenibacillus sp. FJAT-27812]